MDDKEAIERITKDLQMTKLLGIDNICPRCGKRGDFGSIRRYKHSNGNEFIICGWCKSIT